MTPKVRNCPYCDHDGPFDGMGDEGDKNYTIMDSDGSHTSYREDHYRHRCPACGGEFVSIEVLEP